MGLKFFNKKTYPDMAEALGAIRKELKALWDRNENYTTDYTPMSSQQSYMPTDSGPTASGYNGYFKLSLITLSDGKLQVSITDGAGEAEQLCRVNRVSYSVPSWTSEAYDNYGDTVYFCLKFNKEGANNGTVEIVAEDSFRFESYTVWYLLGRLIRPKNTKDGVLAHVVQDHCGSVPQLLWFGGC